MDPQGQQNQNGEHGAQDQSGEHGAQDQSGEHGEQDAQEQSGEHGEQDALAVVVPELLHGDPDLLEVVIGCEQTIAKTHARQIRALAALAASAELGADQHGVVVDPTAPEVACALHWSPGAAGDRVALALDLIELPVVLEALEAGRIDLVRAREIVDGSWGLDADARLGLCALATAFAATHTCGQLRAWLVRAINRTDPEAAARRRKTAKKTRGVRLRPETDGMATLTATLTAEEAVACIEAIRARANNVDGGRDANQADIFVELLTGIAAGQQIPVVVLITADGVELPGYGPVPADLAAELIGAHTTNPTDTDTDTDQQPDSPYQKRLARDLPQPEHAEAADTPEAVEVTQDTNPAAEVNPVEQPAQDVTRDEAAGPPHATAITDPDPTHTTDPREDTNPAKNSGPTDPGKPADAARPAPPPDPNLADQPSQPEHSERPPSASGQDRNPSAPDTTSHDGTEPEPSTSPPQPTGPAAGARHRPAATHQPHEIPAPLRQPATRGSCRVVKVLNIAAAPPAVDRYQPGAAIARHVRARDRHCRFPGCRHPATTCDIDHTIPHPTGPTDPANLHCLCRRHHRQKTHTAWTVTTLPGDILQWTSPRGRTYLSLPNDP